MPDTRREKSLADFCQYLKGVGPTKAIKLNALGIETVNDLLGHYPRRYYDRRSLSKIASLGYENESTVLGQVLSSHRRQTRRRRAVVSAAIGDDTGVVQVVWFNQPYLQQHLQPGRQVVLSGKLSDYRGQRQFVNPDFELVGEDLDDVVAAGRIVPVYRLAQGLSQRFLRGLIKAALDDYAPVAKESLPAWIVREMELPSRGEALQAIHFPDDDDQLARALQRLKLEELFHVQFLFSLQRRLRGSRQGIRIDAGRLQDQYVSSLPFELTQPQKKVLADLHGDFRSGRRMNRLLQGDVGSGKTVVAGASSLPVVEAGYQVAFMVPTEILAVQHAKTLAEPFHKLDVSVDLLIGSLTASDKRRVHERIASGRVDVVVGTHAIIQQNVNFKHLGLVIIDEQHRFGVRQRAALLGEEESPHMLVMTATPIPRTLALTAYADLDLSVLDQMPATRAPIKTRVVPPNKRTAMYDFVRSEAKAGRQAYLLYPLVEETEKQDMEAATNAFDELRKGPLADCGVGLIHGRMKMEEKERAMEAFASGETRVLVTTTVVEVGVHVPQATIIAVHHPERFGLSQLHQLRGRVGRGGMEGFCFLLVGDDIGAESRERLEVLVRESDGFRIAEEDLKLRGPGEFLGTRQSGVPGFKLANPMQDHRLVEAASQGVKRLLDEDPALKSPDGRACVAHLKLVLAAEIANGLIA